MKSPTPLSFTVTAVSCAVALTSISVSTPFLAVEAANLRTAPNMRTPLGTIEEFKAKLLFRNAKEPISNRDNRIVQATLVSAYNLVKPFGQALETGSALLVAEEAVQSTNDTHIDIFAKAILDYACLDCPIDGNHTVEDKVDEWADVWCRKMRASGSDQFDEVSDCQIHPDRAAAIPSIWRSTQPDDLAQG